LCSVLLPYRMPKTIKCNAHLERTKLRKCEAEQGRSRFSRKNNRCVAQLWEVRKLHRNIEGPCSKSMVRKKLSLSIILMIFVLCGCGSTRDQRRLAKRSYAEVQNSKPSRIYDESSIEITGRALVWDVKHGKPHVAQKALPDELNYISGETDVTIFLVEEARKKDRAKYGKYDFSGDIAWIQFIDVYIVQAPEMKPIGMYKVKAYPPRTRQSLSSPTYGDPVQGVVEFIERLSKRWIYSQY
jgi:hypothetical protein